MKSLSERANRGMRSKEIQGAAMEADIQFWNQDFFKEVSDDSDFSDSRGIRFLLRWILGSESLSDSEDSDIDLPEDEDVPLNVTERPEKKVGFLDVL